MNKKLLEEIEKEHPNYILICEKDGRENIEFMSNGFCKMDLISIFIELLYGFNKDLQGKQANMSTENDIYN